MPSIQGWTPKTSILLCDPTRGQGYDIIDHSFGYAFPAALIDELRAHGWLDRLRKARTKMDVDVEKIMQLSLGHEYFNNDFHTGDGTVIRGDESVFIPRDMRRQASFREDHPLLHKFIRSIESTACDNLSGDFELNADITSVQLARYPGDGQSGYHRHCDSGPTCQGHDGSASLSNGSNGRILTFVYYLTPHHWDAELDGGALRIFSSADKNSFDITPYSDRMVVFRSEHVEHQVMPSLRRERIAITVWIYGRPKMKRNNSGNTTQRELADHESISRDLPPPLPLPSGTSRDIYEHIFVAIPSYRDSETWPTIQSLLQAAHHPDRIYVGVVWQIDTDSEEEVRMCIKGGHFLNRIKAQWDGIGVEWNLDTHLRSITMDYRQATGPCYARFLCQSLHRGEEFVLQIDSHMRFRPNWDVYIIGQLKKCSDSNSRVVLSAYPPNYDASRTLGPNSETRPTYLVPWKFDNDNMLRQKGKILIGSNMSQCRKCLLFAAGFNFSYSAIINDCPYEKLHGLFFGEEISMAVRLFTHGYDIFSPEETVCYHQWSRNPLRTRDHITAIMREASLKAVRRQLKGCGSGLGERRSAQEFSRLLGVNFETCQLMSHEDVRHENLLQDAFADHLEFNELGDLMKRIGGFL